MSKSILPGMRINHLTTIEIATHPTRRGEFWICRCDCGNMTIKYVGHLRAGSTKACGCIKGANRTHSMSGTPEYKAWENARARCYRTKDRKFPLYGGRGITMCARWRDSFENFLADMGRRPSPSHSLDRKDSNGNYCPENCRWATEIEQNNNRSFNRHIMIAGNRVTVAEASRITGIPHATICSRLDHGASDEEAIHA